MHSNLPSIAYKIANKGLILEMFKAFGNTVWCASFGLVEPFCLILIYATSFL